jgi:glutathione S-transferase
MPINKFSAKSLDSDVPDKPLIFVVEGRYQNWIKPIILLESLGKGYDAVCIDGPATRTKWFKKIHPQEYVPAMIDSHLGERITSWDSSQILLHLANKYDVEKSWAGSNLAEQLEIGNWLTFETASLGYVICALNLEYKSNHCRPTAKYWVWYSLRKPEDKNPKAEAK